MARHDVHVVPFNPTLGAAARAAAALPGEQAHAIARRRGHGDGEEIPAAAQDDDALATLDAATEQAEHLLEVPVPWGRVRRPVTAPDESGRAA